MTKRIFKAKRTYRKNTPIKGILVFLISCIPILNYAMLLETCKVGNIDYLLWCNWQKKCTEEIELEEKENDRTNSKTRRY